MEQKKRSGKIIIAIVLIIVVVLIIVGTILFFGKKKTAEPPVSGVKVGDIITLGTYEQDNDSTNGAEAIQWQVLDVQGENALVISCDALECKAYHDDTEDANWSDSSLRKWLNSDFYDFSFSDEEKERIVLSKIRNPGTYEGYDDAGHWLVSNTESTVKKIVAKKSAQKDTKDYVFLLSIDEVEQYFSDQKNRNAFLSDYGTEAFINCAIKQAKEQASIDENIIREQYDKVSEDYGKGFCSWWLRSSGIMENCAAVVDYEGNVGQSMTVTAQDGGVRAVMWVAMNEEEKA